MTAWNARFIGYNVLEITSVICSVCTRSERVGCVGFTGVKSINAVLHPCNINIIFHNNIAIP